MYTNSFPGNVNFPSRSAAVGIIIVRTRSKVISFWEGFLFQILAGALISNLRRQKKQDPGIKNSGCDMNWKNKTKKKNNK